MARIPANRVSGTVAPSGDRASRRILKAGRLEFGSDEVLIANGHTSGFDRDPSAVLERNQAASDNADAIREAISSAERSFDRRMQAALQEAEASAYARGLEEGKAQSAEQLAAQQARLDAAAIRLTSAWDSFSEQSEPLVAELAFRMAEAILKSPLPAGLRTVATDELSEAIERVGNEGKILVTMHPADFMELSESGIITQLAENHPKIVWHTDASLEQGDWEAASESSVVRRVGVEMLSDLCERIREFDQSGQA